MKRTIVITGASCFIGRHLTERLLGDGHRIIAVLRPNSDNATAFKNSFPEVKCVYLEMHEYKKIQERIDCKCDDFIALAWNGTRGTERQDIIRQEENYNANIDSLLAAVKLGVSTFVSAGSQAEYGIQNELVSETSKESPITAYGEYKLKFYNDALEICTVNNMRIIEPRFFSLYGPGDFENTLIISTLKKMLKGEKCDFSDCNQKWNYLFIKDAVDAIAYFINNTKLQGGVYNFANKDTRCLKEFIYEMKELTNSKSRLNFGVLPHNDSGINGINPCADKLYATGWKSKYTFNEGINCIISLLNINR